MEESDEAKKDVRIETVSTADAPVAQGPYSQALKVNGMVYCSGQIPLDPRTGNLVEGGIEQQTRQVLSNLKAVLAAAGSSLDQTVMTTVFLADMGDFARVNAICAEVYGTAKPTRSCVQVAALPRGAHIKIDAIAVA